MTNESFMLQVKPSWKSKTEFQTHGINGLSEDEAQALMDHYSDKIECGLCKIEFDPRTNKYAFGQLFRVVIFERL